MVFLHSTSNLNKTCVTRDNICAATTGINIGLQRTKNNNAFFKDIPTFDTPLRRIP